MKALEKIIQCALDLRKDFKSIIMKGEDGEDFPYHKLFGLMRAVDESNLKPGEPIFVIRAQDVSSADGIDAYGLSATWKGATIEFQESVNKRAREFREWQRLNPKYVKRPD